MIKCIASILTFFFIVSTVSTQCLSNGAISDDELAQLVQSTFPAGAIQATGENIQAIAFAVAKAESSGNPSACGDCGTSSCTDDVNPSTSSIGLWQINLRWHPEYDRASLFDPNENAKAALTISKNGQDWTPWSTYKNEMYRDHLEEAALALGLGSSSQEDASQTRPSISEQLDTVREAMNRARYGQQQGDLASTEVMSIGFPVTLTLYVHEGDVNGPTIPDVLVTGQDGAGQSFEQTTDSNGYATITGISGTWSFSASAEGYETNSWSQSITETDRKDAFLQGAQQYSQNSVIGKWALHAEDECISSDERVSFFPSTFDSEIVFKSDGTLISYWENGESSGKWSQDGDAIRIQFDPWSNRDYNDGWQSYSYQTEGDTFEGRINGGTISGTGFSVTHDDEIYEDPSLSYSFDYSCSLRWTASRISSEGSEYRGP